jgi:hypothetical protein
LGHNCEGVLADRAIAGVTGGRVGALAGASDSQEVGALYVQEAMRSATRGIGGGRQELPGKSEKR